MSSSLRSARLDFADRLWFWNPRPIKILPVPVILIRFAVDLWVLIFGIRSSSLAPDLRRRRSRRGLRLRLLWSGRHDHVHRPTLEQRHTLDGPSTLQPTS